MIRPTFWDTTPEHDRQALASAVLNGLRMVRASSATDALRRAAAEDTLEYLLARLSYPHQHFTDEHAQDYCPYTYPNGDYCGEPKP